MKNEHQETAGASRVTARGGAVVRKSASVKSAYRTVDILETLADSPTRLTLGEIQRLLDIPKSSLHSLLHTLVESGWLETNARGTTYGIGLRALRMGAAYLERDPVVEAANHVLIKLRDELNETVHLARLDGGEIAYLASRESAHNLRSVSRIGRRLPAHATALGKVLLAARSDADVDALLPDNLVLITPKTVSTHDGLKVELDAVRAHGWSYEEEQITPGLACIAVAVPGTATPRDALSCSFPVVRSSEQRRLEVAGALFAAAEELSSIARYQDE